MNTSSLDPQQFDIIPLSTETVMLSTTSTQWATDICQDISDDDSQWQTFLRALAMAGVKQWLEDTGLLPADLQETTFTQSSNLNVGDYRLWVLPMGSVVDDAVSIPTVAVTGDQAAHLYVLAEVQEEVNQVRVVTGLRHDQLQQYVQQHTPTDTQAYTVPLDRFVVTPEQLLLYLNCLEPETIIQTAPSSQLSAIAETITTGVVNVGRWLQGELDAMAEQLAWELLPPLTPAHGLRPVKEEIENIVEELTSQGIEIPIRARGACKKINLAGFPCRLYAWVWPLMVDDVPEWSLFLILGPTPGETLPVGIELMVSDQQEILSRSTLTQETSVTYLYTQVIGYWQEQFIVDIGLPNGPTMTLPPFGFEISQG
ncbi:DUF1822 family protein [Leptolyngbyaceae cyanobacterium CCMR0082]|uniref:DUF1822 family protein n=2 Tax=Adonisia turfae TaxID=2950184 RepID=A0A6M0S567_9CYAN|nr:DUF1822 family protein [Adonisia turfae]MDV3353794.1 DUF1822 family protein [Leptothoe sp. LEGE 181152]NEZ55888.1 DUF1822 family protein [Adonisia turfae CCMR0081]NEZ63526.1 DUF1822 family protein [Adonisia turfae CCMR0082]